VSVLVRALAGSRRGWQRRGGRGALRHWDGGGRAGRIVADGRSCQAFL